MLYIHKNLKFISAAFYICLHHQTCLLTLIRKCLSRKIYIPSLQYQTFRWKRNIHIVMKQFCKNQIIDIMISNVYKQKYCSETSYKICINISIISITNHRRTHVGKQSGISSLWTESGCWNTHPRWGTLQWVACPTCLSPYNRSQQYTNWDCNMWFLAAGLVAWAMMHSLNNYTYNTNKCITSLKLQYLNIIYLLFSHITGCV